MVFKISAPSSSRFPPLNSSVALSGPGLNGMAAGRILIVDDDEDIRYIFRQKLKLQGFIVDEAVSIKQASELLSHHFYDIVLLDNYLRDGLGVELIPDINITSPHSKIVMLTAQGSVETAVAAMSRGATDFLLKTDSPDVNIGKLNNVYARERSLDQYIPDDFEGLGLIGSSQPFQKILARIAKISCVETTVLVCGESGTGKELVARAIHKLSPRTQRPFIAINCGAISESLLEAELFGSKKGAFTDSKHDRKGYFETCNDGILLLDEIGEMSPSLQVKFLRVLQEREITPIGSCQPIKINTRIIAATNRNLEVEVKKGNFREDLYYRLAVLQLDLPSLRERKEDIPLLLNHFVAKFNRSFQKNVRLPSQGLLAKLLAYDWPGNVRELHNAVERAVLLTDDGSLHIEDLIPLRLQQQDLVQTSDMDLTWGKLPLQYKEAKEYFEQCYVEQLLQNTHGNITEAARISGQYRPNIYRLIKKYNIDPCMYKDSIS